VGLVPAVLFVVLVNPLIRIFLLSSYLWAGSGVIVHIASVISTLLLIFFCRKLVRHGRQNRIRKEAGQAVIIHYPTIWLTACSVLLAFSCFFAYYARYRLDNDAELRMFIEMYRRECYPFWD